MRSTIVESVDAYPARGGSASRPAVLVLPGGGYQHRAEHEGRAIAEWLAGQGLHAFVLHYPVSPDRHPLQLHAAQEALRYVRSGDHGLAVDAGNVGVIGSSAGGHLAGMLATGVHGHDDQNALDRPDFVVLCYPVISLVMEDKSGTVASLLGPDPSDDARQTLSIDANVDGDTPPAFVWFTADDELVSVEHGMRFAAAMLAHRRPIEFHVFPRGRHGLGLAGGDAVVGQWTALCARWLDERQRKR